METSDDPLFWMPEQEELEPVTIDTRQTQKVVDERFKHKTEADTKRRPLSPAVFIGDWDEPVLSQPALLGVPSAQEIMRQYRFV